MRRSTDSINWTLEIDVDEDTTREGVTDTQDGTADTEQTLPPDSPAARRLAAMDEIRKSRVADLEEEIGAPVPMDDEPAAAQQTPGAAQPQQQLAEQLADDDGFIAPDMMGRKVRLKVDGEEVSVPLEQLVRTAQKESAADRRLREATELLRQAQARALQMPESGETTGNVLTSAAPGPSPDETVKAKLKDALGAIFSGDEDAAAEAFAQVLASRQSQPAASQVDPDALAEVVTQRLDERSALDKFLGTYQRIASNPWLQQAADAELNRLRAEGRPFQEALEEAGRSVYQQFGYEVPQAAPGNPAPATNRQETLRARKADLDIPVGRSVSAAQTRVSPESSEAQRSMTIADMAAARRGERPQARR